MEHDLNNKRCALSEAYISALGTVATFPCQISNRQFDLLKFDAHFVVNRDFGPTSKKNIFTVLVQLKATSESLIWKRGKAKYELKDIDLYNMFRTEKTAEPLFIFVLVLPSDTESSKWLTCTAKSLSMKGCAYWVSLYGAPETTNTKSIMITLKKRNRITPQVLRTLITNFAMTENMVPYDAN